MASGSASNLSDVAADSDSLWAETTGSPKLSDTVPQEEDSFPEADEQRLTKEQAEALTASVTSLSDSIPGLKGKANDENPKHAQYLGESLSSAGTGDASDNNNTAFLTGRLNSPSAAPNPPTGDAATAN
ncbi:MAG: hypothetical protein ABW189_05700 [Rickettsiales bacterium]